MKLLPVIVGLKLGVVLAAAGVWGALELGLDKTYLPSRKLPVDSVPKVPNSSEVKVPEGSVGQNAVPALPGPGAGLSDWHEVRSQIETMRQDVEEKLVRLKMATQAMESIRADANEKLALTRQEKQLLDETLQKEKQVQQERIEQALNFVEKMEPRKAAPVLESMDRDLVVELFKRLKPKTVTKFLEAMNPKKSTEFMEYYTRIRSGREYELLRDLRVCKTTEIPEDAVPLAEQAASKTPSTEAATPEAQDESSGP